jgi:hypothetical protein
MLRLALSLLTLSAAGVAALDVSHRQTLSLASLYAKLETK